MEAIQVLCSMLHLVGEGAFLQSFSAKSISRDYSLSIYRARLIVKALREYGLIYRLGNRYMMTYAGYCIAGDVIKAAQAVNKLQTGKAHA